MTQNLTTTVNLVLNAQSVSNMRSELNRLFGDAGRMMGGAINASNQAVGAAGYGNYGGPRSPMHQALAYGGRQIMGRGGMSNMIGRLGAVALGFGGSLSSLPAQVASSVNVVRAQDQDLSNLNRRVGDGAAQYEKFRTAIYNTGKELGTTREQIIALTNSYVSGLGRMDTVRMARNLQGIQEFAKGYGMDPSLINNASIAIGRSGAGMSQTSINSNFAAAIEAGGMRGRESEVVRAITELTDMLGQRLPTVPASAIAAIAALTTGFNQTGVQGLMGARGQQIIGGLDSFLQTENPVARNYLYRSINSERASRGQGRLGYLGLRMQAEEGIGNPDNQRALMYGALNLPGSDELKSLYMKSMGMVGTMHQGMAVLPAFREMQQNPEKFAQMQKLTEKYGSNGITSGFIARVIAGKESQGDVLREFSQTLTPDARKKFMAESANVKSPEDAAALMAKFGNSTNQLLTEQDKVTKAFSDFSNSLMDFAHKLMPVIASSLQMWSKIIGAGGELAGWFIRVAHVAELAAGALALLTGLQVGGALMGGARTISQFMKPTGPGGMGPALPVGLLGKATSGAAGAGVGVGAFMRRGMLNGIKRIGPLGIGISALEAGGSIMSGGDPVEAIVRAVLTAGGSAAGGALGSTMFGAGAVPGAILGGMAGNAIADRMFVKPDASMDNAFQAMASDMNTQTQALLQNNSVIKNYFDAKRDAQYEADRQWSKDTGWSARGENDNGESGAINPGRHGRNRDGDTTAQAGGFNTSGLTGTKKMVADMMKANGLDPRLAMAIIQQESGWNENAVGDGGHSVGLFQENDRGRGYGMKYDRNPKRQTQRFIDELLGYYRQHPDMNPNDPRTFGEVAQAVQRPNDRAGYRRSINAIVGTLTVTIKQPDGTTTTQQVPLTRDPFRHVQQGTYSGKGN